MTPPVDDTVALAAHGLAGSRLDMPRGPLSTERWTHLVEECRSQELLGYVAGAVAAGRLAVTDDQADELYVLEAESAGLALLVEQRLITLATSLGAAGIDYRVVDGPARTQLAFADACLRHFETVDIVVEPGYVRLAAAMKGPGGHFRSTHRARRRPRIGVRATVLPAVDNEAIVDLADLGDSSATITLGGHRLPALPPEEQLVCVAVEVVTGAGDRQTALLRDLAELALSPAIDVGQVRRVAETWHVSDPVVAAVRTAWQEFDLADKTALSVWAQRYNLGAGNRGRQARPDPYRPRRRVADSMGRLLGRRSSRPHHIPTARFR